MTIEVIVNILPAGDRRRTREIGRLRISNLSDLADISDYSYTLHSEASPITLQPAETHVGLLKRHYRKDNVWMLIYKILGKCKDRL